MSTRRIRSQEEIVLRGLPLSMSAPGGKIAHSVNGSNYYNPPPLIFVLTVSLPFAPGQRPVSSPGRRPVSSRKRHLKLTFFTFPMPKRSLAAKKHIAMLKC